VFDAVLMGKATFDLGGKLGLTSPYPQLDQYLFSRSLAHSPDPALKLVSTDAVNFVRQLKEQPGRAIWLCGGAQLAGALFELIDEVILKQNPVLLGQGIPLFRRELPATRLTLLERKVYEGGFQRLHFSLR
jgi:dihydrofolate reductase